MNKIFGIVASAALVFGMFTACGDDSSSSSWEPSDDEEISSSSEKTKKSSSSEEKKSSSSKKSESSSSGKDSSSSEDTKISSSSEANSSSSLVDMQQKKLVEKLGACDSSNADTLVELEVWYMCQEGRWKPADAIVTDTRDWAAGKDGDTKFGDENKTRCYVYEDGKGWRYGKLTDCNLGLPGCTLKNRGIVGIGSDNEWYMCYGWFSRIDSTKYSCEWEKASEEAVALGSCTDANNDSIAEMNSTYYICKNYWWSIATSAEIHTSGMKCTEKEKGTIAKGVDTDDEFYCTGTAWTDYTRWSWDIPLSMRMNKDIAYDSIVDSRDKQVYKTVKIGSQTWMAQNLNYADSSKTPSLKGGNWCHPHDTDDCKVGGRFYTWAAAIDSVALATAKTNPQTCGFKAESCKIPEGNLRGICPEGWHLPSVKDWNDLLEAVGGKSEAGSFLKSKTGWSPLEGLGNGSDKFGFTALPLEAYITEDEWFVSPGNSAYFWSVAEAEGENKTAQAQIFLISYNSAYASISSYSKDDALSIRCLKD